MIDSRDRRNCYLKGEFKNVTRNDNFEVLELMRRETTDCWSERERRLLERNDQLLVRKQTSTAGEKRPIVGQVEKADC